MTSASVGSRALPAHRHHSFSYLRARNICTLVCSCCVCFQVFVLAEEAHYESFNGHVALDVPYADLFL